MKKENVLFYYRVKVDKKTSLTGGLPYDREGISKFTTDTFLEMCHWDKLEKCKKWAG